MDFTKHLNSIRILTALAFCFVAGASTLGAQVMCGDIITRPSKLTGNLTCVGDAGPGALIVMGPGGKLNLNGFTVDCNNDADATDTDGIRLTGMKALVHSGTVTDCRNGVVVIGSGKHHIASITSELNSLAGFFIGQNIDGNKLNANTAQQNGNDGFLVFVQADDSQFIGNVSDNNGTNGLRFQQSGGGHKVNGNTFSNNGERGISVVSSGSQTIHGNTIFNNGTAEIMVGGGVGGNVITSNMINGNGGGLQGIFLSNSDNNRLEGNIVTGNNAGIFTNVLSQDNRIEGNTVTGNALDMKDDNANCDNNKWQGNTFNTSSQACIN